jgi:hypothetical protein
VHAGRRELARELDAYQLCDPDAARALPPKPPTRGDEASRRLVEGEPAEPGAFMQRVLARAARAPPAPVSG